MRTSTVIDLKHYHPDTAVIGYLVYVGKESGLDLVAADVDQHLFNLLRIVDPLQPALIVDSKDYGSAPGVRQRDNLGCYLFCVDQPNLEFDVGIFASPNKVEQICPVQRPAI